MGERSSANRALSVTVVTCLTLHHHSDRFGGDGNGRVGILVFFGLGCEILGAGKAHSIVDDAKQVSVFALL